MAIEVEIIIVAAKHSYSQIVDFPSIVVVAIMKIISWLVVEQKPMLRGPIQMELSIEPMVIELQKARDYFEWIQTIHLKMRPEIEVSLIP